MFVSRVALFWLAVAGCVGIAIYSRNELSPVWQQRFAQLERQIGAPHAAGVESEMREVIAALKVQVEKLKVAIDGKIEIDISSLLERVSYLEERLAAGAHATAILDPAEKAYQRVDTNVGTFLVSLDDVRPHADGAKLIFLIGNTSNVVFHGFKLTVKWGSREGPWYDFVKEGDGLHVRSLMQERSMDLVDSLLPGKWNRVSAIVSPAKVDKIGRVEVSLGVSVVSLQPDPRR